mgnify:CR=1 FL=1
MGMRIRSVTGADGLTLPDPSMFSGGGRFFNADGSPNGDSYPGVSIRSDGFSPPKVMSLSTSLDQRENSERPYEENVWVRAGVKAIASGFQRMPLRFFDGAPTLSTSREIENHPVLRLLSHPNMHMTGRELWQAHATNFKLDGESFWFLANADGSPVRVDETTDRILEMPAQIIPVRGELVEHKTGPSGWPVSYRYAVKNGGESLIWPRAAVIQFKDYDPYNLVRGLGDVRGVMREVDLYFQAFRYMDGAVRNNGDPGGFLIFKEKLHVDELERRQAAAEDEFGNSDNARRIKVLDRDATFHANPVKPSDMAYRDLSEWLRDAILAAIGVPPPVVGVYDSATYNNIETAHREMWTGPNGILALADLTADVIRGRLLPRLEGLMPGVSELVPSFDSSGIEALRDDISEKLKLATDIARTGSGVSANEMLERLGLKVDPFEQGDRKYIAAQLTELRDEEPDQSSALSTDSLNGAQVAQLKELVLAVGFGELPKSAAEQIIVASFPLDLGRAKAILASVVEGSNERVPAGRQPMPQKDEPKKDQHTGAPVTRAFSRVISVEADAMQAALVRWFGQYEKAQIAKWREISSKGRSAESEASRDIYDEVFDPTGLTDIEFEALLLERSVWSASLSSAVRISLRGVWAAALEDAGDLIGGNLPAGAALKIVTDPSVVEAMSSQVHRLSEGVTSRLANRVKQTMVEALANSTGAGPLRELIRAQLPALTDELQSVFGTKDARAATIVETELGIAENTATYEQYKSSRVKEIMWRSAEDDAVRHSHAELNGSVIVMGAVFANGLRYPQDPTGRAEEIINCRCVTLPVAYLQPDEE